MFRCSVESDFSTPWTVALEAPLSMEFFQARILEWISISSLGYLTNPGIESAPPALAGGFLTPQPGGVYSWKYSRRSIFPGKLGI